MATSTHRCCQPAGHDRPAGRGGPTRRSSTATSSSSSTRSWPYANSHAWFMTMRDGKVIDGTAFYDSISFNDLWTRVEPAR